MAPSPALGVDDAGIHEDRIRHLLRPRGTSPARRRLGIAAGVALLLATSLLASLAVVEAKPLPAAPAEWRSQMKSVAFAMILGIGLPASGDELPKGLEALKAGDLATATASVERAGAASPDDRDALYTLGVIRWQDACYGLGAAKKAGSLDADLATDPAEAKQYVTKADELLAKAEQMKESDVTSTAPRAGVPLPPPPPPRKTAQAPPPPPAR